MTAAFDLATESAFNALQLTRGVSATIRISSSVTLSGLTVVPAETTRDNVGEDGVIISERLQDWLVSVSDWGGYEPKKSHQITVNSEVFDLVEANSEKPFRFHNPPTNTIYRVHTMLTTGESG